MLIQECFAKYEEWINGTGSGSNYLPKVRKFVENDWNTELSNVLTDQKIREFVLDPSTSTENKRVAIQIFFNFVKEHNFISLDQFPVTKDESLKIHNENVYKKRKGNLVVLDSEFDMNTLFDEQYYRHLDNENAAISCKAVIAICLAIGLDTKELFEGEENCIQCEDIDIIEDKVIIDHPAIDATFEIDEAFGRYITEYYKIRNSQDSTFFIKMWDGRELQHDKNIRVGKPSDLKGLVYYILEYICTMNNIEKITITDLKANMVYRSLIATKGSSLIEVVKLYGFTTFVETAFIKYSDDYIMQEDRLLPFFNIASPDLITDELGEAKTEQKFFGLLSKFNRDRRIVTELKNKYMNKCQLCGTRLMLVEGLYYSEAHHIMPLSHRGLDSKENMIILCPNHHKLLDEFIYTLNPENIREIITLEGKKIPITVKHNINPSNARYSYSMQQKLLKV